MEVLRASSCNSQESTGSSGGFVAKCDRQRRNRHVRNPSMGKFVGRSKIDKVLETFEERCVPTRNETYERYVFFKREQLSNQSLDSYITALMKLAESVVLAPCVNRSFATG